MPSRALDLAALGLAAEENDETAIRRAFLRKSRTAHPDKGGTNEEFVALRDAYERLQKNVYAASALPARASQNNHGWHGASAGAYYGDYEDYEQYSEEGESHYEWYDRDWFDENFEENEDAFYSKFHKREMTEEERRTRRQDFLKRNKDPLCQDRKAKPGEPKCDSCRYYRGIRRDHADFRGVDFSAYSRHPEGRITCWICKLRFTTVMTKNMAEKKSWQDAEGNRLGKVLEGKAGLFRILREDNRTFCQQPKSEYVEDTRLSEYYWVEDLQKIAQKQPAIPRSPKKRRVSENAVPGTPAREPRRQRVNDGGSPPN